MAASSDSDRGRVWMRQLRAIALLPAIVVVVVPALLVWAHGAEPGWDLPAPFGAFLVGAGVGLIVVGVRLWLETIRLFVVVGRGTLAPWDPPKRFVVSGPYRRVRNPMISALGSVLLGETAVLGSWQVATFCAGFAVVNAIYIPLIEEPGLVLRFGDDYRRYRRAVPRWIPRREPWTPEEG
jgi:protein-S-isoprenylcysteine O-methyltransferase Ste14